MKHKLIRLVLVTLSWSSPSLRFVNRQIRGLSSLTHRLQMIAEWGASQPEYFDHHIDVNYAWRKRGHTAFIERGVHSLLALSGHGATLDLACGDGYFAKYLYATRSNSVLGVDANKSALVMARLGAPRNVTFQVMNLLSDFPTGQFNNVVWDVAIQHFDPNTTHVILSKIRDSLTSDGILSGSTVIDNFSGKKQLIHHQREFESSDELRGLLKSYFENVHVYTTQSDRARTNAYFYATNSALPAHVIS